MSKIINFSVNNANESLRSVNIQQSVQISGLFSWCCTASWLQTQYRGTHPGCSLPGAQTQIFLSTLCLHLFSALEGGCPLGSPCRREPWALHTRMAHSCLQWAFVCGLFTDVWS